MKEGRGEAVIEGLGEPIALAGKPVGPPSENGLAAPFQRIDDDRTGVFLRWMSWMLAPVRDVVDLSVKRESNRSSLPSSSGSSPIVPGAVRWVVLPGPCLDEPAPLVDMARRFLRIDSRRPKYSSRGESTKTSRKRTPSPVLPTSAFSLRFDSRRDRPSMLPCR